MGYREREEGSYVVLKVAATLVAKLTRVVVDLLKKKLHVQTYRGRKMHVQAIWRHMQSLLLLI